MGLSKKLKSINRRDRGGLTHKLQSAVWHYFNSASFAFKNGLFRQPLIS